MTRVTRNVDDFKPVAAAILNPLGMEPLSADGREHFDLRAQRPQSALDTVTVTNSRPSLSR
jgi:hypothetical protein